MKNLPPSTVCFSKFKKANLLHFRGGHLTLLTLMALALSFSMSVSAQSDDLNNEVISAYHLRITGKIDSAKTRLSKVLQEHPDHVMANFEMGRLLVEENPFQPDVGLPYIDKAIAADPTNSEYAFFRAKLIFTNGYIAMVRGNEEKAGELAGKAELAFEQVIQLDPVCDEAYLYLVDLKSGAPGTPIDTTALRSIISELRRIDRISVARAEFRLAGDISESDYWQNFIDANDAFEESSELLARAYLNEGNIEKAEAVIAEIIDRYPNKEGLYLDIGRAYVYRVMQGSDSTNASQAKSYLLKYLDSDDDLSPCVVAWTFGLLSRIEHFLGSETASQAYLEQARSIYPAFSRAMAVPIQDMPPDEPGYHFSSFFRPF